MNDPLTQTLFRFVSLRSPELSEEEGKQFRFIFQPEEFKKGVFYEAIASKAPDETKKKALANLAASFTNFPKAAKKQSPKAGSAKKDASEKAAPPFIPLDKEGIKKIAPELFTFAEWLVRNRSTYTLEDLWERTEPLETINNVATLWDNLFYQIITQKNFYAKEAIMQLLVANHLLHNYRDIRFSNASVALQYKMLNALIYARVVLPAALFDDPELRGTGNNSQRQRPSATPKYLQDKMNASIAAFKLRQIASVKKELSERKASYREAYEEEYEKQKKAHQKTIENLLNRKQFQKKQSTTEKSENDTPELPKFNFTFPPEIDEKTAKKEMSLKTYNILSALQPVEKIKTFKKAQDLVLQEEKALTEMVFAHKTFAKKSVSIKGTVMPVSEGAKVAEAEGYTLILQSETQQTEDEAHWNWEYYMHLISNTADVAIDNMTYHLSYDNGNEGDQGTAYQILDAVGTGDIKAKLFSDQLHLELETNNGIPILAGTIELQNGRVLDFSYQLQPDTSVLLQYPLQAEEEQGEGEADEENEVDLEAIFVPPGYGMRQLGIADYRKVEQSVHCYLEGEVSHIENVMSREYREKFSRRFKSSKNVISSVSETEKEKLTDTTTTDRFEMQNEISKVLSESQDMSAYAGLSVNAPKITFNSGANYASHTAKEDSIHQAVAESQEITARAMDRVVQRVKEERITKIIEEFEETNKHGFDNRKGNKHIVGVYRWVDKVYKNQIYNYGKRLMYEFAIPQPSKLHRLALTELIDNGTATILEKPIDPRTIGLEDATKLTEANYKFWVAAYDAEVETPLEEYIYISKSFSDNGNSGNYISGQNYSGANAFSVEISEHYKAVSYKGNFGYSFVHGEVEINTKAAVSVADNIHEINNVPGEDKRGFINTTITGDLAGSQESVGIGFHGGDVGGVSISVEIQCERTLQYLEQWKDETFQAIILAYRDELAEYEDRKKKEEVKVETLREANPLFYRQVEQAVLRKNCISYMIDQTPEATRTYGKKMYRGEAIENYEVNVTKALNGYTTFAQFIEQAFEWEMMSYKCYPFYWGNRQDWKELYQYENNDPLYRSFMQAGLARVVVTIRPGFEDAVMHYVATGRIWNGGQLPVLDDPLYLAIVDELKAPKGVKEGKAWKTRIPTSLTILQADSIGLKVEKALPCDCDDLEDFQESDQNECHTAIENDETIFENLQVGAEDAPE